MSNTELAGAWVEWLSTRPRSVQEFAAAHPEFMPGYAWDHNGETLYFLGYGEYEDGRVGMLISRVNPGLDYDRAVAERESICPDHF